MVLARLEYLLCNNHPKGCSNTCAAPLAANSCIKLFPSVFRKDKVIKEDSRITWECKKGKKNRFLLTLRIKNPTLKDAGLYRCNAFNSFGDSNANIDLKFESK